MTSESSYLRRRKFTCRLFQSLIPPEPQMKRSRPILAACVCLALLASSHASDGSPARTDSIRLSIRSMSGKTVRTGLFGNYPRDPIEITLRNDGPKKVVLVMPGEGSDVGARTPVIDWEIRDKAGNLLRREGVVFSGNRHELRSESVFDLAPHEERTFKYTIPEGYPYEEGHKYLVTFKYENRPNMKWPPASMVWAPDDPDAVQRLANSTPCQLVSNTIELKLK